MPQKQSNEAIVGTGLTRGGPDQEVDLLTPLRQYSMLGNISPTKLLFSSSLENDRLVHKKWRVGFNILFKESSYSCLNLPIHGQIVLKISQQSMQTSHI